MAQSVFIEDFIATNPILSRQGVVDGFGHVSAPHEPDPTPFLSARSMAPGLVTADDIMEFDLDLDADALDPRGRPLYVERFIRSARPTLTRGGAHFAVRAPMQSTIDR